MTLPPDTLAYRLVYDATRLAFPAWPVAAWGIPAALLGTALLRWGGSGRAARWAGTTLAIFGPAWVVIMGAGLYNEHARLRSALRSGEFSVVEGVVYDRPPLAPGSDGDAAEPAWVVESGPAERPTAHWYRYAGTRLTPGYHRARPGDGELRDGTRVRLADVGGRIARVEVEAP